MANPKKPIQLKKLAGTARHDRADATGLIFDYLEELPPPPEWLPNTHAVNEWLRLTPVLVNNKMLTEANLGQLAHYCALHGKIVQGYVGGFAPSASLVSTLNRIANDFGLTPIANSKIGKPEGAQSGNKFASNKPKQKHG